MPLILTLPSDRLLAFEAAVNCIKDRCPLHDVKVVAALLRHDKIFYWRHDLEPSHPLVFLLLNVVLKDGVGAVLAHLILTHLVIVKVIVQQKLWRNVF